MIKPSQFALHHYGKAGEIVMFPNGILDLAKNLLISDIVCVSDIQIPSIGSHLKCLDSSNRTG